MRKFLSLAVSALLAAVLLTACRSASDAPAPSGSDQSTGSQSVVETLPDQPGEEPSEEPPAASSSETGEAVPEKPPEKEPVRPAEPPEEKPAPEPTPKPEPKPEPVEPPAPPAPKPEPPAPPEPPKPEPPAENKTLYVLMYHDIVPDGVSCNNWTITTGRLREDMVWLKEHGYTFVLPRELKAGVPLPPKAVMVTFDDGYESNYTLGLPIFQELNAKCVVALITHHMEDKTPGFLSWDQCRALNQSGLVEIASHTHNLHVRSSDPDGPHGVQRLTGETREAYEARVFTDLQTSIDLITKNLGQAPGFLAYPHGLTDEWEQEFTRAHFNSSVTTRHGPANVAKGFYNMNRHNISMGYPPSEYLPG